jgi:hypothetical protein
MRFPARAYNSPAGATARHTESLRHEWFRELRNTVVLGQVAELCHLAQGAVVAVGESSVSELKTRPDYAVTVHHALVGFVELKAPGKGADPRKFKDPHDKAQWEKLRSLPNLLYTDGNA